MGLANGIEKRFRQAGRVGLRRVLKGDELIERNNQKLKNGESEISLAMG